MLARTKGFDRWPDTVDYAHELVSEDIALLEGEDLTVIQVEIRTYVRIGRRSNVTKY